MGDHSNSSRRMRATGLVVLTFLSAASVFATEDGYSSSSSSSSLSSSSMSSNSLASPSSLASSSSRTASASRSAVASVGAASSGGSTSSEVVDNRLHPAHEEYHGCQYVGEWGDCDPFKMIRIKEERLVLGDVNCQEKKNTTKPCAREDLPPGTMWLIHEQGQALFNAYNELRKRLMDIRREITIIGQ